MLASCGPASGNCTTAQNLFPVWHQSAAARLTTQVSPKNKVNAYYDWQFTEFGNCFVPSFLTAISEGSEPTAADKATIDHQISSHEIAVYVYNSQNATPDIQRQIDEATGANIPITTIGCLMRSSVTSSGGQ